MSDSREPDVVARFLFWLPLLLIAAAAALSLLALPHLPEQMPIHWGIDGQPTRVASRTAAVVLLLALMFHAWLMVGLIGWAITRSPEARTLSPRVMPAISAGVVGMLMLLHLAMLANGMGWNVSVPRVAVLGCGALFVLLGFMMRDVAPNPVFGVRTPTTLRSPAAWRRANQVGGRGFVYAGVATMLAVLLPPAWSIWVLLGSITLAAAAAVIAGRRAEREAGEGA